MRILHAANVLLSVVTGYLWRDMADDRSSRRLDLTFPVAVALIAPIYLGGFIFLYVPIGVVRLIAPRIGFVQRVEQTMRRPLRASITSIVAIGFGLFLRTIWEGGKRRPTSG